MDNKEEIEVEIPCDLGINLVIFKPDNNLQQKYTYRLNDGRLLNIRLFDNNPAPFKWGYGGGKAITKNGFREFLVSMNGRIITNDNDNHQMLTASSLYSTPESFFNLDSSNFDNESETRFYLDIIQASVTQKFNDWNGFEDIQQNLIEKTNSLLSRIEIKLKEEYEKRHPKTEQKSSVNTQEYIDNLPNAFNKLGE